MAEKGFTLIEMLVALAVTSIILTGALLTIHQILVNTDRNNDRVIVLTEVHRVALKIKKDLQSNTSTNATNLQVAPTTIEWTDHTGYTSLNASDHSVIYSLSGQELSRNYDGVTSILSRNIESLIFSDNGTHVNVVITSSNSTLPGRSETLSFGIRRRSDDRYD